MAGEKEPPRFESVEQSPDAIISAAQGADVVEAYGESPDDEKIAMTSFYETIKNITPNDQGST